MDSDPSKQTVGDLLTTNIVTVEATAPVAGVLASRGGADWIVVVTGATKEVLGLLRPGDIDAAVTHGAIGDLVSKPVVVLPPEFEVANLADAEPFQQPNRIDIGGVVVLSGDDQTPIGVWAGDSFDARLFTMGVRGTGAAIETSSGGPIRIGTFTRSCKYQEAGGTETCGFVRSFKEKPSPLPACDNPSGLRPHAFAW